MSPHSAILQIRWEIHEQLSNGMFSGTIKDQGLKVCELRGQSMSLAKYHLDKLLKLIEENSTRAERHTQDGIDSPESGGHSTPGIQGDGTQHPKVQPMRGTFARRTGR